MKRGELRVLVKKCYEIALERVDRGWEICSKPGLMGCGNWAVCLLLIYICIVWYTWYASIWTKSSGIHINLRLKWKLPIVETGPVKT